LEFVRELLVERRDGVVLVRHGHGDDRGIGETGKRIRPDFEHALPRPVIDDLHAGEGDEGAERLCRTYETSKTTNCGRMATMLPSSASRSRVWAASYCFFWRPVRYDKKTFASTAARCTSDASSRLRTSATEPPLISLMVVDSEEVIFAFYRAGFLPSDKEIRVAVRHPEIVRLFADYYDAIWQGATRLEGSQQRALDLLQEIRNRFPSSS
jgi:hypothetical protein